MAGMVENRSFEMNVEMLSPSSAGEVCGADAGRYNARAVLPQGAFDVQSIRASQTADPRAKQTHPSGPTRRSARVNSRLGDGYSHGSALSLGRSGGEFSEPAPFGLAFLRSLSTLGLSGVALVTSDAHQGLKTPSPQCLLRPAGNAAAPTSWPTCSPECLSVPNPVWPPWCAPSTSNSRQKKSTHRRTG